MKFATHIDMLPEKPSDYIKIAEAHEAAAERFEGKGLDAIVEGYRSVARRNRTIATILSRFDRVPLHLVVGDVPSNLATAA